MSKRKLAFGNGCSWWPDHWLLGDLGFCCQQHDIAYEIGGNEADRQYADLQLFKCVKKAHSAFMAWVMWLGVKRLGKKHFNYK